MTGRTDIHESWNLGLLPDLDLDVDEWADRFQIIPKSSGSNEYGSYKTSRTPHAREIMKCLSDRHPCKVVVAKMASQMMKTQIAMNWLLCSIHQSPSNFLLLLPTGNLHKRIAARIDKNIAAVAVIRERVAKPNSRDSRNNQDIKEYVGGALFMATAGSAANLAEVPARRVAIDEVDRGEDNVNGEGDPVKLAEARQTTFEHNRKSYYYSSPTREDESRIDQLFKQGTQREALAECIHCGHAQRLVFENLIKSDDGEAMYPCIECGGLHRESDKKQMFLNGRWSESIGGDGKTESFTASAMFLPYGWKSWSSLMKDYNDAEVLLDAGDESEMIVFYNTRLARCWERSKEKTQASSLLARAEDYRLGTVPAGGVILTAAIDTQADRLELKVVAWGRLMECWVVDYRVIIGNPADDDTWQQAYEILSSEYLHHGGAKLRINTTFIDSGGHFTQEVYNFSRKYKRLGVFAIKGDSRPNRPIIPVRPSSVDFNYKGQLIKKGVTLWSLGTDTAKDYLYARWTREDGAGAVHFCNELPDSYYAQIVSEYRTTKYVNGKKKSIWEKKRSDRNEALDLMVYNLAAAHKLGLHRWTESQWLKKAIKPEKINEVSIDKPSNDEDNEEIPQKVAKKKRLVMKKRGKFNPLNW